MQKPENAGWQGPSLSLVLGAVVVVTIAMGCFAFWRYTESERWVQASLVEMEAKGKQRDVEGCIDAAIEWRQDCAANTTLCNNAIPLATYHCLEQQDRSESCMVLDHDMSTGIWLMEHCRERGNECKVMKKCPCAAAYRALDSFCRSGQESVQVEL